MENYNGILSLYQQRGARSEPRARSTITEEGGAERAEGSIDVSMQDWLEDQKRERLDIERQEEERREEERLEQERLEQERREQERLERVRKRGTKIDLGRVAAVRQTQERQQAQTDAGQGTTGSNLQSGHELVAAESSLDTSRNPQTPENKQPEQGQSNRKSDVWITFKIRERGVWRTAQTLHVDSSDPSQVERTAIKYMRKADRIRVYDTDLNVLTPEVCFKAAIANRAHLLLLIPERDIDINEELEASVAQLLSEVELQMESRIE